MHCPQTENTVNHYWQISEVQRNTLSVDSRLAESFSVKKLRQCERRVGFRS